MPTNINVGCASCGDEISTSIDENGDVDACFGNTIIADEELVLDDAKCVGEYLSQTVPEGKIAVVYAECTDCCPSCNTKQEKARI